MKGCMVNWVIGNEGFGENMIIHSQFKSPDKGLILWTSSLSILIHRIVLYENIKSYEFFKV